MLHLRQSNVRTAIDCAPCVPVAIRGDIQIDLAGGNFLRSRDFDPRMAGKPPHVRIVIVGVVIDGEILPVVDHYNDLILRRTAGLSQEQIAQRDWESLVVVGEQDSSEVVVDHEGLYTVHLVDPVSVVAERTLPPEPFEHVPLLINERPAKAERRDFLEHIRIRNALRIPEDLRRNTGTVN